MHAQGAYKEVLLKDGLQSVTASVQAGANTLQSQSEYDAWGQRAQQGNSASRHGYTGHLHDSESGLIYARARYYNPMLGRFISQDPLQGILNSPITWNAYLYGNGNPLLYWDPTGEAGWLTWLEEVTASSVDSWGQEQELAASKQQTVRASVLAFNQGLAYTGHSVAWFLNATSDLIVRNNELAGHEEAAAALAVKEQSMGQVIEGNVNLYDYVSNNPAEATVRGIKGLNDWSYGILTGDADAWSTVGQTLSGCVIAPACLRSASERGLTAAAKVEFGGSSGGYRSLHRQKGMVSVEGDGPTTTVRSEASPKVGATAGPQVPATLAPKAAPTSFWSKGEFNGTRVYQRDDLIDINFVDARGRTNIQRMHGGLAPIGPDGKSLNIHHVIQTADGPLAEMTATFHQQNSRVIHINPNTIPSGIDRRSFDVFRRNYWKNRANDFLP